MEERTTSTATDDDVWSKDTVPKVFKLVSSSLTHSDLVSLLLVSPFLYRTLLSSQPLWQVSLQTFPFPFILLLLINSSSPCYYQLLNFREFNNAGNRLIAALSLVSIFIFILFYALFVWNFILFLLVA